MIYYLVYQLTCTVNGKIYVGCHITDDVNDNYMGSGKRLSNAKKKYGVENFKKEILSVHETAEEMFAEEKRIIDHTFLARPDVYNLALGGSGGIRNEEHRKKFQAAGGRAVNKIRTVRLLEKLEDPIFRAEWLQKTRDAIRKIGGTFNGKKHSAETRKKMKASHVGKHVGELNSQHGTKWINDGVVAKKIQASELASFKSLGWVEGRKFKR